MTGKTFDGRKAAEMGLVNDSVPLAELRETTRELALNLLEKNPVVLRAAKNGFKRCRELTWNRTRTTSTPSSTSRACWTLPAAASRA